MKKTRMANRKILKWVASGVMLALLFAIVFAGTLSGAFGVEESLKNSGVIENNVADAVTTVTDKNLVLNDTNDVSYADSKDSWSTIETVDTISTNPGIYNNNSNRKGSPTEITHEIKASTAAKSLATVKSSSSNTFDYTMVAINAYQKEANKKGYKFTDSITMELTLPDNAQYISLSANIYAMAYRSNSIASANHGTTTTLKYYDYSKKDYVGIGDSASVLDIEDYNLHETSTAVSALIDVSNWSSKTLKLVLEGDFYCYYGSSWNSQKEWVAGVGNLTIDVRGFATGDGDENPYELTNRSDFDTLSTAVSLGNSFEGKKFIVKPNTSVDGQSDGKTIDMGTDKFAPIGSDASHPFKGTFEGNSCIISGLVVNTSGAAGLFGVISGATISNITVNGTVSGGSQVGGLVGLANSGSTLSGKITCNTTVTGTGDMVGGVVGQCHAYLSDATFTHSGSVSGGDDSVGGVFGFADGGPNVYNEENELIKSKTNLNGATNSGTVSGKSSVGGIVGRCQTQIIECTNNAKVSSSGGNANENKELFGECTAVGGITGHTIADITNCVNNGTINAESATAVGGIVGVVRSGSITVSGCSNNADITAQACMGGIVAYLTAGTVSGCKNNNTLTANGGCVTYNDINGAYAGGIAGYANGGVDHCYNGGKVTTVSAWSSSNLVGGIVGYLASGNGVSYCYSNGTVEGSSAIGGIVGSNNGTVDYCYFEGNVKIVWNNGGSLGYIVGAGSAPTNSWKLQSATADKNSKGSLNSNHKALEHDTSVSYLPAVWDVEKNEYTTCSYTDDKGSKQPDWTQILTKNINAFVVTGKISDGQFFESRKDINSTEYLTPNSIENESNTITARYNAETTIDIYCAVTEIGYETQVTENGNKVNKKYNAGRQDIDVSLPTNGTVYEVVLDYGKDSNNNAIVPTNAGTYTGSITIYIKDSEGNRIKDNNGNDIVVGEAKGISYTIDKAVLTITPNWSSGGGDNHAYTYNAGQQGLTWFKISGLCGSDEIGTDKAVKVTYPTDMYEIPTVNNKEYTYGLVEGVSVNANQNSKNYSATISIEADNYTLNTNESVTYTWTIEKFSLAKLANETDEAYEARVMFGGFGDLIISNTSQQNWKGTSASSYVLNNALIYTGSGYVKDSFGVWVKYYVNDSNIVSQLISSTDYVLTTSTNATTSYKTTDEGLIGANETPISVTIKVTATENGNFTGYIEYTFTAIGSDFGKVSNGSGDWGSEGNPFVISHPAHLIRLSEIVNGATAWDSIYTEDTTDDRICLVTKANVNQNITSRTYANAYFLVTNDIDLKSYLGENDLGKDVSFTPIGKNTSYPFSGIFDGNNCIVSNLKVSVEEYAGLFGYISGASISDLNVSGYAHANSNYAGLLVAYMDSDSTISGTIKVTLQNGGSNDGVYGKYAGGLVGVNEGSILGKISVSGSEVDNENGGVYCMGGVVGYNIGTINANITASVRVIVRASGVFDEDLSGEIEDDEKLSGAFAGGIVGYNSGILKGTFTKSGGDVLSTTRADYVGGIVGYNCGVLSGIFNQNSTMVADGYATVYGGGNVGGIAGYWVISGAEEDISVKNCGSVSGSGSYVGGVAGWLEITDKDKSYEINIYIPKTQEAMVASEGEENSETTERKDKISINIDVTTSVKVTGKNFVGYLFGGLVGNGYGTDKVTSLNITKKFEGTVNGGSVYNDENELVSGGAVLGGLVGYLSKSAMICPDWDTKNITFGTMNDMSFVGGLVGVLGENGYIKGVETKPTTEDGSITSGINTITANTDKFSGLGSFVGGVVGYVTNSAGVNGIAFEKVIFTNTSEISGGSYVGGIFGGVGGFTVDNKPDLKIDDNISTKITNLLTNGTLSGEKSHVNLALSASSEKEVQFKNSGNITGADYVGGLIGYVGRNVTAEFTGSLNSSDETDSAVYCGATDENLDPIAVSISGVDYVGGIFGYLDNVIKNVGGTTSTAEHKISHVVARVKLNGTGEYVGGIAGYMTGGRIEESIAMLDGTEVGTGYVGGLVGGTNNVSIVNSFTQGLSVNDMVNNAIIGGLVGGGVNPSLENSWAFLKANSGSTYSDASKNTYGKYVAVDESVANALSYENLVGFTSSDAITFVVKASAKNYNENLKNTQLVFYDASGNDNVTNNASKDNSKFTEFEYKTGDVTIGLDKDSAYSMLVYTLEVKFVNVPQGKAGDTEKVRNSYRHPSNSQYYDADVTGATFDDNNGTKDGYITSITANIYFNPYGNAYVLVGESSTEYKRSNSSEHIGYYDYTYGDKGTENNPYTISNWTEWQEFANTVTGNNNTTIIDYSNNNKYVSLTVDLTESDRPTDVSKFLAGDSTHSFSGTFDGNGHYIDIGTVNSTTDGTSLFPYAGNGATFKNLTIKGTIISSSGNGTAGFVGIAGAGNLTFENCTSEVTISASGYNVGGILGQSTKPTAKGIKYVFIDCVNTGNIINGYKTYKTGGVGGIIGNILTSKGACDEVQYGPTSTSSDDGEAYIDVALESCRNAGVLQGTFNVGGIIGRNGGVTTITNCGNSGPVTAYGANWSQVGFTDVAQQEGQDTSAGGIGGLVTQKASTNVYATYNSGKVVSWGNKAGGILAADCEYSSSSNKTHIYYCYNTGDVSTGGIATVTSGYYGCNVGGILGTMVNADIQYCYNTGNITAYGYAHTTVDDDEGSRAGGIVGFVDSLSKKQIMYCYSIGTITGVSGHNKDTSQIIGGFKVKRKGLSWILWESGSKEDEQPWQADYITVQGCYSLDTSCTNTSYANGGESYLYKGTPTSLAKMTAIMSGSMVDMPTDGFGSTANNTISQSIIALSETKYDANDGVTVVEKETDGTVKDNGSGIAGISGGYIYVYGCLPQLAVFAVDTQNGLAMTSVAYGVDQYGDYSLQTAGSESNPFVVKDGIDLLGLQSLVEMGYTFKDKYIEFANSKNNLEKTESKYIDFNPDNTDNRYKSKVSSGSSTYNDNGKSYHLFEKGDQSAITYDDSTTPAPNMLAIGSGKAFQGNISGKQYKSDTEFETTKLVGVKISTSGNAGLFANVLNTNIEYIELENADISGTSSDSHTGTGGIVGYAYGSTTIDNCKISGTSFITSSDNYVGGIVGKADTANDYKDGTISSYAQSVTLTISNCEIAGSKDNAITIQGSSNNIGGILGGIADGASGNNNIVLIADCNVSGAKIKSSEENGGTHIGGILGYGSENIIAGIKNCTVGGTINNAGTSSDAMVAGGENDTTAYTVEIKGNNNVGGIAGAMSAVQGGYIQDCTVGTNATITITDNCSNIGGLVGSNDRGDGSTLVFLGNNGFAGTINIGSHTANGKVNGDDATTGIGGIIGTMNNGASFASGSNVTVKGTIEGAGSGSTNIGGVAGYTVNVAFSGTFNVNPTMRTSNVDNVGGFIGKNAGEAYIHRDNTEIYINGTISGLQEVGGFIGVNDSVAQLVIGIDEYQGTAHSGTLEITINAEISAIYKENYSDSGNNVGGIVGKNDGALKIYYGTISTTESSSISGHDYVGGIVGLNDGELTTGSLTITNGGNVSGSSYVGGVFGSLAQGAITGRFKNSGSVIGTTSYVGGSIGFVASGVTISNATMENTGNVYGGTTTTDDNGNVAITGTANYVGGSIGKLDGTFSGKMSNAGEVYGANYVGGSIGYVGKDGSISNPEGGVSSFTNTGAVTASGQFVGGSIGILYGSIAGTNGNRVAFSVGNKQNSSTDSNGTDGQSASETSKVNVSGTGYVGGSIGVIAGSVEYATFTNNASLTVSDGQTAIGGSVGMVGVPSSADQYSSINLGDIKVSNSDFNALGELTVNGSNSDDGGVGGAIGIIGGSQEYFSSDNWTNNTYYAMGDVIANGINNVGGVFGLIKADKFEISNMLAYGTTVRGYNNVGGIVGGITGSGVVIKSAFALEGNFSGTSNVGGIVGLAKDDTDASQAYWMLGVANSTIAEQGVSGLADNLGFKDNDVDKTTYEVTKYVVTDGTAYSTGFSNTGWFFIYANDTNDKSDLGNVSAWHNIKTVDGKDEDDSLAYWKFIAQAYSADERIEVKDDDDNILYYVGKDSLGNSALTGSSISVGTIYATATAGGNNGYYMYTATSNGTPNIVYDNTNTRFDINISITSNVDENGDFDSDSYVGNFAVYYRQINAGEQDEQPIYNGYERIGVVGMEGVEMYTGTDDIRKHKFVKDETKNEREKYYFTTSTNASSDASTPINVGTYYSSVNIYYVDSDGNVYSVGANNNMVWNIVARQFDIQLNDSDGKEANGYYGQHKYTGNGTINDYDMKFVISNIAPGQYNQEVLTITVNNVNNTMTFRVCINEPTESNNTMSASWTSSNAIEGVTLQAFVAPGSTLDADNKKNKDDHTDYQTKTLTCYLAFNLAAEYKVTLDLSTNGTSAKNYSIEDKNKEFSFSLNTRALTVLADTWTDRTNDSYVYNTKFQGLKTIKFDASKDNKTGLVGTDTVKLAVTVKLTTSKGETTASGYTESFGNGMSEDITAIIQQLTTGVGFAGTYTVSYEVATDGAGKYSIPKDDKDNSTSTHTWIISPYEVQFDGFSNETTSKTYDATALIPVLKLATGRGISYNSDGTYKYGDDTLNFTYEAGSDHVQKLVNADTYNIKVENGQGCTLNAKRNDLETSDNYTFAKSKAEGTFTITARSVKLEWESTQSFVYKNENKGLKVTGATADKVFTYTVNSASIYSAELKVLKNGTMVDVITLSYNGQQTNVCSNKKMSYSTHSVDENYSHDGVASINDNYTITGGTSPAFSITPSILKITGVSATGIKKVYDGNTTVNNGTVSWTIETDNNGYVPKTSEDENSPNKYFKLIKKEYVDKNVGTRIGVSVEIQYVNTSSNYKYLYEKTNYTNTIYSGEITTATITVRLNLSGGKATKVYDSNATFGGNGVTGNGNSATYNLGNGFKVDGIISNDNVKITAVFKEANSDNSDFDSYVNGVYLENGTYQQDASKYFKNLVFTKTGKQAGNYSLQVSGNNKTWTGTNSVTVNGSGDNSITIEITKKTVRVEYTNTYQSYVAANGTYNTDWNPVGGSVTSNSDIGIQVTNGWMYNENGTKKQYKGYTVITGQKGSNILSAQVDPTNGMNYNYTLSNQPTLTIAYIVSDSADDAFEIDSMADLIIASVYYSAYQNTDNAKYPFVNQVQSSYTWHELVSQEDYNNDASFALPSDLPSDVNTTDVDSWRKLIDALEAAGYPVDSVDNDDETIIGYIVSTSSSDKSKIPTSFKLIKDLNGILTADDITMLNNFFTVTYMTGATTNKATFEWGVGKTSYLSNLLTTKEGSVVSVLGSLFVTDSGNAGFGGTFDGNGYVIEYLNIMGYGYNKVGLFDVIGSGTVKNLHLRNISIYANGGNVGGIAGTIENGTNLVTDVSFHGSINVSGATNVGGLFGQSSRAIQRAIVLGTINSSNSSAYVGGVVGISNASISYVVSMMQITANGKNTGAFVGSGTDATDSFHMKNAIYNGASFVNVDGKAVSYSDLMTKSNENSAYNVIDVGTDASGNARQSLRLVDIVKVYLLMYSLQEVDGKYTISTDSWLVGNKLGTNATNDAIIIANKQNVSLLRELRFATFELATDIDVTISSTFSGTFYGTVETTKDGITYAITCNKEMFGVYLNDKSWLKVPQSSN